MFILHTILHYYKIMDINLLFSMNKNIGTVGWYQLIIDLLEKLLTLQLYVLRKQK